MPASLAVATLIVCTFWGIASGLVGAVVVLMGVIAFNPMLRAGYDVKLASGVITAGGTLGILIPPSVMIIVYAAVAGQSVVKLYAAAMFPGFFLALLYLVYIVGWAMINPKIAPRAAGGADASAGAGVDAASSRRPIRATCSLALVSALFSPARAMAIEGEDGKPIGYWTLLKNFVHRAGAVRADRAARCGLVWWYVVIHQQVAVEAAPEGLAATGQRRVDAGPGRAQSKRDRRQPSTSGSGIAAALGD